MAAEKVLFGALPLIVLVALLAKRYAIGQQFGFDYLAEGIDPGNMSSKEVEDALIAKAHEKYNQKETLIGASQMRYHERMLMLQIVDSHWKDHLLAMDHLKEGIGLRGYGQRDPLNEYKAEAFNLFETMSTSLREAVTSQLMRVEIRAAPPPEEPASLPYMEAHKVDPSTGEDEMSFANASLAPAMMGNGNGTAANVNPNDPTTWGKVGRNEECPCGSGKKFKHCHGRFG